MTHVQEVSHIVFSTQAETFLAIQDDPGRLPIANVRRCGSRIEWLRADGGGEAVDVADSPSERSVLARFESSDGLLMALYPDLGEGVHATQDPQFLVISSRGVHDDNGPCAGDFPVSGVRQ